jgi:hypothetical protein
VGCAHGALKKLHKKAREGRVAVLGRGGIEVQVCHPALGEGKLQLPHVALLQQRQEGRLQQAAAPHCKVSLLRARAAVLQQCAQGALQGGAGEQVLAAGHASLCGRARH